MLTEHIKCNISQALAKGAVSEITTDDHGGLRLRFDEVHITSDVTGTLVTFFWRGAPVMQENQSRMHSGDTLRIRDIEGTSPLGISFN